MAEVVIMPKLGFNMDEGTLMQWNIKVGQPVQKGEALFEIETDKTTIPVEATADGFLLKTLIDEGCKVPVFTPIAVVGEQNEDPSVELAKFTGSTPATDASTPLPPEESNNPEQVEPSATTSPKLTPRARRYAQTNGIPLSDAAALHGTGFQGGVTEKDIKASPLAKRTAEKLGVDITKIQGTGVNGKVMAPDVRAATVAAPLPDTGDGKTILEETPYAGTRKIIGDRLSQSKFTAPHLYFSETVDTSNLNAFRKGLNESLPDAEKVGVNDLLVMAASKALRKFPQINASLLEDRIVMYASTNIGIAVAGDKGLIVPVIKNAQAKTLSAIARESKDLIERARIGRLQPEEYTQGTFTISNLGMFGIENFTAIINPPESAILSVSSVREKPVVINDENGSSIAIRPMMNIQLSVDHRIIDGLLAARFIGYFRTLLETPIQIIV